MSDTTRPQITSVDTTFSHCPRILARARSPSRPAAQKRFELGFIQVGRDVNMLSFAAAKLPGFKFVNAAISGGRQLRLGKGFWIGQKLSEFCAGDFPGGNFHDIRGDQAAPEENQS